MRCFCTFQKLPKIYHHPKVEELPCLVTLSTTSDETNFDFFLNSMKKFFPMLLSESTLAQRHKWYFGAGLPDGIL
jgi:hypothetical protein